MYYIIPENGWTGKEYASIRWIAYPTFEDARAKCLDLLQTLFAESKDNFGRHCLTGINHAGFSSTLAILDDSKKKTHTVVDKKPMRHNYDDPNG